MERWSGRVALVTGASMGIGAAIAYQLQDHGVHVVAVARRVEKIEEAVEKARQSAKNRGQYHEAKVTPGKLYPQKCDIANEDDILTVFKWIKETLGGVDILVNNASAPTDDGLTVSKTADWKIQLDVNVLGLSIFTREAVQGMRVRGVDDGHIVHIGSINAGPNSLAMYLATKAAVNALTEGLRKDFVEHKSNMKVSCIRPGLVYTEALEDYPQYNPELNPGISHLNPEDIADAVVYSLGTPPHVQIHEIIIRPTNDNH